MSVLTRAATITSGLVLYLDAANRKSYPGTGTTWFDMSGNNNSGSIGSSAWSQQQGGAISPVISNSTLTANTTIFGTADFSVDVWFKPNTDRGVRQTVTGKYNTAGGESGWAILYDTTGSGMDGGTSTNIMQIMYSAGLNGGLGRRYVNGSRRIAPGNNINATLVRNNTVLELYVNGFKDGSANLGASQNYYAAGISLGFGQAIYSVYGNTLDGSIYSSKIYNRALSSSEVLQNYNATKARFGL